MNAAKARAALEMQVRVDGGAIMLRHKLIEDRVANGATLMTMRRFGTVLQRPDGAFLDTRNITKTGLDYAAFILADDGIIALKHAPNV